MFELSKGKLYVFKTQLSIKEKKFSTLVNVHHGDIATFIGQQQCNYISPYTTYLFLYKTFVLEFLILSKISPFEYIKLTQ